MNRADHALLRGIKPVAIVLPAVFLLDWFGSFEQPGLLLPDEGRFAERAREMVATDDRVTPKLKISSILSERACP